MLIALTQFVSPHVQNSIQGPERPVPEHASADILIAHSATDAPTPDSSAHSSSSSCSSGRWEPAHPYTHHGKQAVLVDVAAAVCHGDARRLVALVREQRGGRQRRAPKQAEPPRAHAPRRGPPLPHSLGHSRLLADVPTRTDPRRPQRQRRRGHPTVTLLYTHIHTSTHPHTLRIRH